MKYELYVGNIGCVHRGNDGLVALGEFDEYVKLSKSEYGRASNEEVTLFKDGELIKEYIPDYDDVSEN